MVSPLRSTPRNMLKHYIKQRLVESADGKHENEFAENMASKWVAVAAIIKPRGIVDSGAPMV